MGRVWEAFSVAVALLVFSVAAVSLQSQQAALADEVLKVKDRSLQQFVKIKELENNVDRQEKLMSDTVKILALARELIVPGPVKHGRLKGRLKELGKPPEDPCVKALFADLVRTLKTDEIRDGDYARLLGRLERCYERR